MTLKLKPGLWKAIALTACLVLSIFSASGATAEKPGDQTPPPASKGQPPRESEKAPKVESSGPSKSTSKTDPKAQLAIQNKEKARELLNRCYQEALGTEPRTKAEAISKIAAAMRPISKERALYFYEQAFQATGEIQSPENPRDKIQLQFQIVMDMGGLDPAKALEHALRMDQIPISGESSLRGLANMRSNALSFLASRLAEKDPDRAFEIVQQQIAEGNYDPSFLAPLAIQLKKTRPDKSEQLFIEAMNQFAKPSRDQFQVQSFVNLTTRLFSLNPGLTEKALDLIVQAIDDLEKKQQDQSVAFAITSVNSQGKSASVGSIREFAVVQLLAMMKKLNPEKAKSLEEHYAKYRDQIAKNPNGIFPFGDDPQAPVNTGKTVDVEQYSAGPPRTMTRDGAAGGVGPSSSGSVTTPTTRAESQSVVVAVRPAGSGSTQTRLDPNRLASQLRSQMQVENAVRTAQNDPQAAMNVLALIESPTDRAKALARIAPAFYGTDPDKAKSLLADAYSVAEKITDSFDRAQVYAYIAEGYLNFDRDRAQSLLGEAFVLADKVVEEEASRQPNSLPFADRTPPEFRRSNQLYQLLLPRLARLNIEDAIARTDQISDKRLKLLSLINIADYLLNDGKSSAQGMRIVIN